MNYTDFSKTGGFPLDADVLEFNHKALAEVMKWPFANLDGSYPEALILSGCVDDGGDNISAGWLFWQGEILPFRAGFVGDTAGKVYLVENAYDATFADDNTYAVLEVDRYVAADPNGVEVGNIQQMPRYEEVVGSRAATGNWLGFSGVSGPVTWQVQLRRNTLTRLVCLRGSATINANAVSTPAIRYLLDFPFPPGFLPSADVAFGAYHDYHSVGSPDDPAIRVLTCKLFNLAGWKLSLAPVRPQSSSITTYKVLFNTVYSLD